MAAQNSDGGWAYGRGGYSRSRSGRPLASWTEPTVFALLAQSAAGVDRDRDTFASGVKFLRSMEGPDGGFRPQPDVRESTWVTALVLLLPEGALDTGRYERAIAWLKNQTGRETGWSYRLQQLLRGNSAETPRGWPWFPGAAAWVIPTSLGIMAFERALAQGHNDALSDRVAAGRDFLLSRQCADGGWNHGSNQALGRDGDSYPETTGIALLALGGAARSTNLTAKDRARIESGKAAARKHLALCRAAEGIAWLRMGLAAHGESVRSPFQPVCRTNMDEALTALADARVNPLTSTVMSANFISLNRRSGMVKL
jgi:hypothetical protein